jgi:hypothetical protein
MGVFKRIVVPAASIFGGGSLDIYPYPGWSQKDVDTIDPVEVALMVHLQNSTLANIIESTSSAYVGPCNAFVIWCGCLLRPF